MINPIAWIRHTLWQYKFNRTPTQPLGNLIVKDFRGSLYCVGVIKNERRLKLRYLKGSKEAGLSFGMGTDMRMWDILEPTFPEYAHSNNGYPTFSRESLVQFLSDKGFIKGGC